jgi:hypothetical protein
MRALSAASLLLLLGATACDDSANTRQIGSAAVDCKVTLNNLAGTQWVMH